MIPDYETVMLPLLRLMADGKDRTIRECREELARGFQLTEGDLAELLPSGRAPRFNSRVHWAKTYLEKAKLLQSPRRGTIKVTDRGLELLAERPQNISTNFLAERYPEMRDWREASRLGSRRAKREAAIQPVESPELTPEELLELSYRRFRESIQNELLDTIKQMPPAFFERLVVDLLLRLGYGGPSGSGVTLGQTGDRGVDGVIQQDKLGLDLLYVQAKRWEGSVGSSVIREFAGALSAHRARKGVIITTSTFTRDALADAQRMSERIVLVDGPKLTELLYDTGLGLVTERTYDIKRLDTAYFEED